MELRDYQVRAVESVYSYLRKHNDNPCIVIPTGGGKSPVIARICRDAVKEWNGRVILLTHVKELIEQSYRHLMEIDSTLPVGIYSAGLGERDPHKPITIASIQSASRRPDLFEAPNLILVDEAHRIPADGEGTYRSFISSMMERNPECRVIGFTATPYRLSTGDICQSENILNKICFEVGVGELVAKGFLCPLTAYGGSDETDFSALTVRAGEFVSSEAEHLLNQDVKVARAVCDLVQRAQGRKSILIFAQGIEHGQTISRMLTEMTDEHVAFLHAGTNPDIRSYWVEGFRYYDFRWLVNVDVLTTGFDATNIDCVAIMRATMSPGLYVQMCGRGSRIHPDKKDALIVDFGGNVLRHGLIDDIHTKSMGKKESSSPPEPKKCPDCFEYLPPATKVCDCGHEFSVDLRSLSHNESSYKGSIIAGDEPEEADVKEVRYSLHYGKDSGIASLRVQYDLGLSQISEYVCLEHPGFARQKAVEWWKKRTGNSKPPDTIEEALDRVDEIDEPSAILVKRDGKYFRVLACKF